MNYVRRLIKKPGKMKIAVITSPKKIKNETVIINVLFSEGLEILHLRKPGASEAVYSDFIKNISPEYRNRIVVHDYYNLVDKYGLKGIHLKGSRKITSEIRAAYGHVSKSCHSFDEMAGLEAVPDYCFLSPVFDSISKSGYSSAFDLKEVKEKLKRTNVRVFALGGITRENITMCEQTGFDGVAVLGYLWENPAEAVKRFRLLKHIPVLSIAGFDPTSGAGVTADLKTFEAFGVYGLGVNTAITMQNTSEYRDTLWIPFDIIKKQCDILFKEFSPGYIKIGLIENFDVLQRLVSYLKEALPDVKIIWDPVMKSTSGCRFHKSTDGDTWEILKNIWLITPNSEEYAELFGTENPAYVSKKNNVGILLKGGHSSGEYSVDSLYIQEKVFDFRILRQQEEKHGTGCILSSAVLSAAALGRSLQEACCTAQNYVSKMIGSNLSKVSFHHYGYVKEILKPSMSVVNMMYITSPGNGLTDSEQIELVCRGGAKMVQLRMKDSCREDILREAVLAKSICRHYGALLIIDDDVDIARLSDADGVHLGKEDMNPVEAREILGGSKIIGATCNTWEDIERSVTQHVDYIGLGPFRFTRTKKNLSPVLGLEGYGSLMKKMKNRRVNIPVYAIGGINIPDIEDIMKTGVAGVALSGVIRDSRDISYATSEIETLFKKIKDE